MNPMTSNPSRIALAALMLTSACAVEPDDQDDPAGLDSVFQAVTLSEVTSFGSNPGALKMFKYVPAGLPTNAPLVVALHGCTQSASVYSTQTEWGNLADRFRFAVVFAQQSSSNNISSCFNWFQSADVTRGQGEALSIKQMVDTMKSAHGSDPTRVFVTGMSAGGVMTEVMMATYPDVFAGGSVNSGLTYGCANSIIDANGCQMGNVSKTPQQWGTLVRNAFPGYTGPYPRLIAFHGSTDATVKPADLQQSVDQWSNVLGIDETPEVNESFRGATHKVFRDASGRAMIETYLLNGVGHALTVDPGSNADQGGATGAFSEDHNIYSSFYAAQFWGLTGGGNGDTVPPTAAITSPASGATLTGTVTVTATASDDVGVTRVELAVDGATVTSDASAPFSFTLDTTTLGNGAHSLSVKAFDAANNAGTSASVAVSVSNGGGGDTVPPTASITSPASGATLTGTITVTANASDNVGVTRVELAVDGAAVASDASAPFSFALDTTTLGNGAHSLSVKAFDAANNAGTSVAVAVNVSNGGGGQLLETFSSSAGPDNPGWTFGGWTLAASDATGTAGSRSLSATASPAFNTVTRTASWTNLRLGASPKLSYVRQLALRDANVLASTGLSVIVNDGADHVVDAKTISGFASYSEPTFTARSNIDLSAFAGKTITLKLVVTATDPASLVSSASAVIDQIQIQ